MDDEERISGNILTNAIEAKENAKEKANEKIQLYYNKQKSIYQKNVSAISYNVGGTVYILLACFYIAFIMLYLSLQSCDVISCICFAFLRLVTNLVAR